MAAECDHDHDGYVMGYQHALDYVFEYVEHLAMDATGRRIEADGRGLKHSVAFNSGLESAYHNLLAWISEEDGDDDDQLTVGGQGAPAGGLAARRGCGEPGDTGESAAAAGGEAVHRSVAGALGDG